LVSVEEAIKTVLECVRPLPPEKVSILEARGRVLAEDILAPRNLPPKDNSAMDGFALRAADSEAGETHFKIIGQSRAGGAAPPALGPGEAVKIMTGACLPEGADAVVPVEEAAVDGDILKIRNKPLPGDYVRQRGEDVAEAELVLASGSVVKPADVAMAASLGRSFVLVGQRPRVAIMATGDELVDIDGNVADDRIINSNAYGLAAQTCEAGGTPVIMGIAPDDPDKAGLVLRGTASCDVVITTGGVSMGDYDFMRRVFDEAGVKVKFWKAAMKPGKPVFFGLMGGRPVFGLPGNPVSAMVCFEQFVRPCLKLMQGNKRLFRPVFNAVLDKSAGSVSTDPSRADFMRCRIELCDEKLGEDKQCESFLKVVSIKKTGSNLLSSMTSSNALMILPVGCSGAGSGDVVQVQILDDDFFETDCFLSGRPYYECVNIKK